MHPTKNDLPKTTRKQVIAILAARLADAMDLYGQVKQAHWNVRGPNFIALHELFDKVASSVSEHADTIAERILQLGDEAMGTVRHAAKHSSLKDYPLGIADGTAHAEALAKALAAFTASCRKAIDKTDKAGDKVTSDMFTEITGELDKHLWFVEAHLPVKQ